MAQENRLHVCERSRKELSVHFSVIEARHWAAIQPHGTGGKNEVTALQSAVPESAGLRKLRRVGEPASRLLIVRKQSRKMIVEFRIVANDGGHMGRHRL